MLQLVSIKARICVRLISSVCAWDNCWVKRIRNFLSWGLPMLAADGSASRYPLYCIAFAFGSFEEARWMRQQGMRDLRIVIASSLLTVAQGDREHGQRCQWVYTERRLRCGPDTRTLAIISNLYIGPSATTTRYSTRTQLEFALLATVSTFVGREKVWGF